jgi:hypothetical protein
MTDVQMCGCSQAVEVLNPQIRKSANQKFL